MWKTTKSLSELKGQKSPYFWTFDVDNDHISIYKQNNGAGRAHNRRYANDRVRFHG